jgi:hypothetical protein
MAPNLPGVELDNADQADHAAASKHHEEHGHLRDVLRAGDAEFRRTLANWAVQRFDLDPAGAVEAGLKMRWTRRAGRRCGKRRRSGRR